MRRVLYIEYSSSIFYTILEFSGSGDIIGYWWLEIRVLIIDIWYLLDGYGEDHYMRYRSVDQEAKKLI